MQLAVRDQLRDPERIADAVQETFARALASLDKLRDPERFRPWLLSIARHTAVDFRRNQNRVVLDELTDLDVATPSGSDPAELAALRDVAGLVRGLVLGLSQRDAVALNLVTLGFEVADVAAALEIKHGAAKVVDTGPGGGCGRARAAPAQCRYVGAVPGARRPREPGGDVRGRPARGDLSGL